MNDRRNQAAAVRRARQTILTELLPFIKKAKDEGKMIWCRYNNLLFTPDHLLKEVSNGRFIWGVKSWELRDIT